MKIKWLKSVECFRKCDGSYKLPIPIELKQSIQLFPSLYFDPYRNDDKKILAFLQNLERDMKKDFLEIISIKQDRLNFASMILDFIITKRAGNTLTTQHTIELGLFHYLSGSTKDSIQALHSLGLSCSYDTMKRVLDDLIVQENKRTIEELQELANHHPEKKILIIVDN